MAASDYIPVGRTSLVRKGELSLQVQTEYASRPNPRVTTSIFNNGRMLHKIERTLDTPVTTPEEQLRVEMTIKRQHTEIIAIIEGGSYRVPSVEDDDEVLPMDPNAPDSLVRRISALPGVQRVYHIDNEGNFVGDSGSEQFRKMFSAVLAGVSELLELFERLPGVGITRARGVYEVERDRLYLASAGRECFFVLVRRVDVTTNYEKELKEIVTRTAS